jgi:hypothetical protein
MAFASAELRRGDARRFRRLLWRCVTGRYLW